MLVDSCGITASVKNWLCAATQTTLLFPPRYSVGGMRGMQANPRAEK